MSNFLPLCQVLGDLESHTQCYKAGLAAGLGFDLTTSWSRGEHQTIEPLSQFVYIPRICVSASWQNCLSTYLYNVFYELYDSETICHFKTHFLLKHGLCFIIYLHLITSNLTFGPYIPSLHVHWILIHFLWYLCRLLVKLYIYTHLKRCKKTMQH